MLNKLIDKTPSNWEERALFRLKNREWLDISANIALKILRYMRANKLSADDAKLILGVDDEEIKLILSGSKDFKLSDITSIQEKLKIVIINDSGI